MRAPSILALGGSTAPLAASERALRIAAQACVEAGAEVELLTGRDLIIPVYDTEAAVPEPAARTLVEALRRADGILLASPGYHGAVSGLVKNALDYAEELRHDERPYLEMRAVGIISVAHGWQTAVSTLEQLRTVVHALRGWPTPLGVAVNDAKGVVGADAESSDPALVRQLRIVAAQVVDFARMAAAGPPSSDGTAG